MILLDFFLIIRYNTTKIKNKCSSAVTGDYHFLYIKSDKETEVNERYLEVYENFSHTSRKGVHYEEYFRICQE